MSSICKLQGQDVSIEPVVTGIFVLVDSMCMLGLGFSLTC